MDTPEQSQHAGNLEKLHRELAKKWSYEIFKQYLLTLARNPDALLPREQFPDQIELSPQWHEALNLMRVRSHHHELEEWMAISYRTSEQGLFLPVFPIQGKHDHVPGEWIQSEVIKLQKQAGFTGMIGDVHTHPRKLEKSAWKKIFQNSDSAAFSVGDLYALVMKTSPDKLIGVVEGEENIFSFRTQESKPLMIGQEIFTQEGFEKFWYERNGWQYIGDIVKNGAQRMKSTPQSRNHLDINKQIAQRHNLVLYKGRMGKNLVRIA